MNEKGSKLCFGPFLFGINHQALLEWVLTNKKIKTRRGINFFIIEMTLPGTAELIRSGVHSPKALQCKAFIF